MSTTKKESAKKSTVKKTKEVVEEVIVNNDKLLEQIEEVDKDPVDEDGEKDYEENKKAVVVVPDNQLSLAIGKEGQNARLAAKLTNWKIDIKNQSQADEQGIEYNYIFCDEEQCNGDVNA